MQSHALATWLELRAQHCNQVPQLLCFTCRKPRPAIIDYAHFLRPATNALTICACTKRVRFEAAGFCKTRSKSNELFAEHAVRAMVLFVVRIILHVMLRAAGTTARARCNMRNDVSRCLSWRYRDTYPLHSVGSCHERGRRNHRNACVTAKGCMEKPVPRLSVDMSLLSYEKH